MSNVYHTEQGNKSFTQSVAHESATYVSPGCQLELGPLPRTTESESPSDS